MRRVQFHAASLAFVAVFFAGCGGGGAPTAPSASASPSPAGNCGPTLAAPPPPAATDVWLFAALGAPLSDPGVQSMVVDPSDGNTWYVGSAAGLYVTRDSGLSWTKSLTGNLGNIPVQIAAGDPCTILAAENIFPNGPHRVRRSGDKGRTWTTLYETAESLRSIHAGRRDPRLILAGTQLDPRRSTQPDAVYRSLDAGVTWMRHALDGRSRGLIPWDIEEDLNGAIYSGTEIYDHPQPYRPPFFRSPDLGAVWQETAALPWHVSAIQAHPSQPLVYALTEGAGLYSTTDTGASWRRVGTASFALDLKLDPLNPARMFGGELVLGARQGGFYVSANSGESFRLVGLQGLVVGSIALDPTSRIVYVAAYNSGLYRAVIPTNPTSATTTGVTAETVFGPVPVWDRMLPGMSRLTERPR